MAEDKPVGAGGGKGKRRPNTVTTAKNGAFGFFFPHPFPPHLERFLWRPEYVSKVLVFIGLFLFKYF